MKLSATRIFAIGWMCLVLSACGGGGGDRNCSDFAYQEDAQAWHNSNSNSDLDSDRDGIACESLPRRTGGSGGSGGSGAPSSNMSLPSVMVFDLSGQVSAIEKLSTYYVRSSVSIDGGGGASQTGIQFSDGRFALDSISRREFMIDYGGPEGYPARYMPTGDAAYAWPTSTVATRLSADLGGTYNYMGKRCVGQSCSAGFGQFSLDTASLSVAVCENGSLSACAGAVQRYNLNSYVAQSSTPGVYRFTSADGLSSGFVAFGSPTQGAVGIAMNTQGSNSARLSAFAARANWTYRPANLTTVRFHAISIVGTSVPTTSAALIQGATMESPMSGFFRPSGNSTSLNMVMSWPARVLAYDGSTYTLWLN